MIRFRRAFRATPCVALWAVLLCAGPAWAGAEQLALIPPLDEALPWADTPQGVKTTAPFLLNPTTIVPAGTVVRVFYVRPYAGDESDGIKLIHNAASKDAAYSRQANNQGGDGKTKKVDTSDVAVRAAHQTVWPNVASFRAALALLSSADIRLVYVEPGEKDLDDQALTPVQGMILAEKDGVLTVAGVLQGGNAAQAGLAAGDRIDLLNGAALNGSLATFTDLYAQASAASTISKPKPYLFRVRHAGSETPVEIAIRPPPALGGSLLDQ